MVTTGFQCHVERSACCSLSCHLEGKYLRMCATTLTMCAATRERTLFIQHDATDQWVGLGTAMAADGKKRCPFKPISVSGSALCHGQHVHECVRTASLSFGGITRYSEGSIVLLALPCVIPRRTVV